MGLFNKFSKKKGKRVFVLGLDGMPFSYAKNEIASGKWPVFKKLLDQGSIKEMNSVVPPISSVAWASFMTGKNPAKHNIFGFIDKKPGTFDFVFPNASHLTAKTLWDILSENGKRVIVINIPVTYPPKPVNGIVVGGFLSPSLKKAVYPEEMYPWFEENGYVIDADAEEGHENPENFINELYRILDKRFEILFKLLKKEQWDFFIYHIMETDRLYHFCFGDKRYEKVFSEFHQKIDSYIGELLTRLPDDVEFIALSDHGFTSIKNEVNVNYVLWDRGFLQFTNDPPGGLPNMAEATQAYSFIPGRIFVNLEGREPNGSVKPGKEFDTIIEELKETFTELENPDTGERIIDKIFLRDEIYKGDNISASADMLVLPKRGYELKANFNIESFFMETDMVGVHTYDDALVYARNRAIADGELSIMDIAPSILNLFGITTDYDMDGRIIF